MFVQNPGAAAPFLLIGDHAGREIPPELGDLGVPAAEMDRHIAWDIGVRGLGERLSAALDATFVAQTVSRLVIDCNRDPARADAICEVSDGTAVPGNVGLSEAERARRVETVFRPYHAAIAAELDRRPRIVVALHSFTPRMAGSDRPWGFGVLHLGGSPFCDAMLARLRAEPDLAPVGDNEPYRMDGTDFTVPHHAIARGLDYLELEVRQDLIAHEEGQADVAERLVRLLPLALGDL
jgi:predicted N-formylglutamate amidohydrolase